MGFDNDCSQCGFIGNLSLDEVIANDTRELQELGGSFEEIADRMDSFITRIEKKFLPDRNKKRADIFRQHGYDTEEIFDVPGRDDDPSTPRGRVMRDINTLFRTPILVPGENEIEVVDTIHTRGMQRCPYVECGRFLSSSAYVVRNTRTGRELYINQTTEHLAREHHLLEKGNEYGITPREFYESFMFDRQVR